jgi:pimeloyl-ACP methyl ester carboxylesterase
MGHKPFLVIADYLTRAGFAVLRYDDRGYGKSTGDFGTATTLDFANDAEAALEFLRKDPRIIKDKIGIIGHSEGALIAPIVASADPGVAFIVMLAPPGLTGRETLNLQNEILMKEYGEDPSYIDKILQLNNKIYDIVTGVTDNEKAAEKIRKEFDKFTSGMSPQEKQQHGLSDYIIEKTIKDMLTPWMRVFLDLDIKPYLARTHCPILILVGSKDIQVDPKENIPPIENTLRESGNPDYRIEILTGLNHLFQQSQTGSPSEYAAIEETFSPMALEMIKDWIKELK